MAGVSEVGELLETGWPPLLVDGTDTLFVGLGVMVIVGMTLVGVRLISEVTVPPGINLPKRVLKAPAIFVLDRMTIMIKIKPKNIKMILLDDIFEINLLSYNILKKAFCQIRTGKTVCYTSFIYK